MNSQAPRQVERHVLDLRHLAGELAPLLRPGALRDVAQLTELAETAWRRLLSGGPVLSREDPCLLACFRALPGGRVECLAYDPADGPRARRVVDVRDVLHPDAAGLWLHLQTAEPCPPDRYADLVARLDQAEQRHRQATEGWEAAEAALHVEGLLPVRALAPPSAVGGARYLVEMFMPAYLLAAFRETLAYWGAYILHHRPMESYAGRRSATRYYTVSLASCNDQWQIGLETVHQYYADLAERGGLAA